MSASSFQIRTRTALEEIEQQSLAAYATQSCAAHKTRQHDEPEHAYRTAFQRDRDRIVHSRAFRRLKHKRQVFLTSESDHYRTRITHTLEVAQLARTIARSLGLNEDLTEAIALGHDLGHTPFGHLGEVVLDKIVTGKKLFEGQGRGFNFGGFKHNYQGVRVVDLLERKYEFPGLNLTAPVREGILKHTRLRRGDFDFPDFSYAGLSFEQDMATTLESQVVAICDEIAQRTHDLEDGARAKLVSLEQIRTLKIVQIVEERKGAVALKTRPEYIRLDLVIRGLINYLIEDVIEVTLANLERWATTKKTFGSFDKELVHFSMALDPLQKELNKFIYKEIINFSRVKWSDDLGEKLLFRLFQAYYLHPEVLPAALLLAEFNLKPDGLRENTEAADKLRQDARFFRTVCDYIAGMTDSFSVREAERLSILGHLQTSDLRLEFALGDHI